MIAQFIYCLFIYFIDRAHLDGEPKTKASYHLEPLAKAPRIGFTQTWLSCELLKAKPNHLRGGELVIN